MVTYIRPAQDRPNQHSVMGQGGSHNKGITLFSDIGTGILFPPIQIALCHTYAGNSTHKGH